MKYGMTLIFIFIFMAKATWAKDDFKVKYEGTITYKETDGTEIELPRMKGTIYFKNGAVKECKINIGGWVSNIVHICNLQQEVSSTRLPKGIIVSDDTFVSAILEGLKYLPEEKKPIANKIFNSAEVYVDNQLVNTRKINQTTTGEFKIEFKPTKLTLKSTESPDSVSLFIVFKSINKD